MPFTIDEAIFQARTAARIVEDERGGPIRRIINGRHHKPTGRYSSAKVRRALPWEDTRERIFFWYCEADAGVVTYLSQPHRLEINVGRPSPLIYFPDVRRDMADGSVEIREIKKVYDPAADEDYDLKVRLADEIYRGLGWSFRIIEAAEIAHRQTLETVWAIQRRRHAKISARDCFKVTETIERLGGTAPFQILAEALGGGPAGAARVCACIVRRIASVDIRERFGPDLRVTLTLVAPPLDPLD